MLFYHYFSLFSINIDKNFQKTIAILCKLWYNASIVTLKLKTGPLGQTEETIMSGLITKRRTNDIVVDDKWLAYLAKNSRPSEEIITQFTNAPQETEYEYWYENNFRHCLYLVAVDKMAQLCIEAKVNVPNEETLRGLTFHKKLWKGCKTKEAAIKRLQAIAKLLNW